ncbi:hypothetical protein [Nocardia pseudovaccinii]|uniref:hypothetical protein n=1 Tax=Nocardia pseudovaccinii TaxID=189540 RepID=UPI0012F4C2EA|nr:hypothetical protein [Nocardia pseudovaccinii]
MKLTSGGESIPIASADEMAGTAQAAYAAIQSIRMYPQHSVSIAFGSLNVCSEYSDAHMHADGCR